MTRPALVAGLAAASVVGCHEATAPEPGSLAIIIVANEAALPDRTASGLRTPATRFVHFDSVRIYLDGGHRETLRQLGDTAIISGLTPKSYLVTIEGWGQPGLDPAAVDWFGQGNAVVIAGDTVPAVVPFNRFRPALNTIASPSTSVNVPITFQSVANAAQYDIQYDTIANFVTQAMTTTADTSTTLTVSTLGPHFVRVRARTPTGNPGIWSNTESFSLVVTSVDVSPDSVFLTALSDTITLTAQALDDGGNPIGDVAFGWSSDTTIAAVNSSGFVTTFDPGTATITATAPGANSDSAIVVIEPFSVTAHKAVARGYGAMLGLYSLVSDELDWVGTLTEFQPLQQGNPQTALGVNGAQAVQDLVDGQGVADQVLQAVLARDAALTLPDRLELARAYIFRAIAYITIADMFDDWALSDTTAPVGAANMTVLYASAISGLTSADSLAQALADPALELLATALRARAYHAQAVWAKVGTLPVDTSGGGIIVFSGAAVADANAALILIPSQDWSYSFMYDAATGAPGIANWVNQMSEFTFGSSYAEGSSVLLPDLIDVGTISPALDTLITRFLGAGPFPALRVVSAREMHLIIAENQLAVGGTASFQAAINELRMLDGLGLFDFQVSTLGLLRHARQTNLFLQGRRLADLYRFNLTSPAWLPGSAAVTTPGTFFARPP